MSNGSVRSFVMGPLSSIVRRKTLALSLYLPQEAAQRQGVADGITAPIVVEVGEDVQPLALPLAQPVGPPAQIVVGVRAGVEVLAIGPVQANVDERGRRPEDAGQIGAAHHAVSHTALGEKVKDVVAVPALVPELDRGALAPRQPVQEVA